MTKSGYTTMDLTLSNDLLCCENASVELDMKCQALKDPNILGDNRVLDTLLEVEENYMPNSAYFSCVQKDIEPSMREILSHWMLDVCHKEQQQEEVFTLAMNLVDRFLSLVEMKKQQLQLLGSVCLLLSSKLKENPPMDARTLVMYADGAFRIEDLRAWEMVVLSRLKWDISAITPHAFLDQILDRLQLGLPERKIKIVRKNALFFIKACATDSRFTIHPSSMVASAAVASAIQGVLPTQHDGSNIQQKLHPAFEGSPIYDHNSNDTDTYIYQNPPSAATKSFMQEIYNRLHSITQIDTDCLKECHHQIDQWTHANSVAHPVSSVTPTDVQDIIF